MAELVDALDSKSCIRKDVQVRFLFWAQITADLYRSVFSLVQADAMVIQIAFYFVVILSMSQNAALLS